MIEPWDIYTQVLGIFFPLAVAVYTYRLSRFLRGGILHRPFQFMVPAFLLYAVGSFIDLLPLTGIGPIELHAGHFSAYLLFFVLMTYSIYLLYKAWQKVGMGKV